MKNVNTLVHSALATVIALGALGAGPSVQAGEKKGVEKCYGVAKAGKNDCKTLSNACAGHSVTDGQQDAFIALPKGTCERIVGGSLEAPAAEAQ
ncbi:MAG: BufA1 family periplasmic bufferin-type metallophore [Gammaproteobacteria bacterium]